MIKIIFPELIPNSVHLNAEMLFHPVSRTTTVVENILHEN